MIEKAHFIEKMRDHNPSINEDLLLRAWSYSKQKHGKQKRASGEDYFSHPLEVADILANLRLDSATIATALLHDTIEDTSATHKEVADIFGEEIARLVEGVTKFTKIERLSESENQAESFKKFFIATAGDVRVLLVKLADRLHNMRTLEHLRSEKKRERIAEETLIFYAPLAGRMGMQKLREELEELSFRHLHPKAYKSLRSRMRPLVSEHSDVFHNIADELKRKFKQFGIEAEVSWRMKKFWSIWKKMERRSISLEQIADLMGFRIIVKDVEDCYRVLGVVHTTWRSVPNRFKDYISMPKPNGYQSIHSTVIGPKNQRIDLQIRTELMHENAEYGIAAHWKYKEEDSKERTQQDNWLRSVVEMLEHGDSAQEFLEHTKMEMFEGYLFCFTKKGRLIVLPQGARPIDFAYAIHTDIGDSYASALVNGYAVSFRHLLQDGDEVEIIPDKNVKPEPFWEGVAKTGRARSSIRRALRAQEKQTHQKLGEEILVSLAKTRGKKLKRALLERALGFFKLEGVDNLLEHVGGSKISGQDVLNVVFPEKGLIGKRWLPRALFGRRRGAIPKESMMDTHIPIKGNPSGIGMRFARNHFPIPGDGIVGILIPEKGVRIYPSNATALSEFESKPARWINLEWDIEDEKDVFLSRIVLQLAHEVGALATITSLIAEYGSNIDYLELIRSDKNFRTLNLDIEVHDVSHAKQVIAALQGLAIVHSIRRETEPQKIKSGDIE